MVTIAPMRTSFGNARYGSFGEDDFVCSSPILNQSAKPALIICHPRGSSALGMFADPLWVRLYQDLSEKYVVSVSDLGGPTRWGNSTTQSAISAIRTQLINNHGALNGKMGLLGISMGGLAAFNYAKANPSQVAFVCGMVPALNIANLKTVSNSAYGPEINTAYGGNYTDGVYGNTYSPHYYRYSYPASSVRTGIWYSSTDDICLPQWALDMQSAQESIEVYSIRNTSGVAPEHEYSVPPTIEGNPSGLYEFPKPADWCNQRRVDSF